MFKSKHPGNSRGRSASDRVPTVRDFSPAAIRQALKRYSRDHWSTRYSAVLLLLSILAGGLFGFSELVFYGIVATLGAGCLSWVYNYYIQAGNFEYRYVEQLQRAIQEQTEHTRERLKQDLIDHECPDGAEQLDKLQAKFDSLVELLADKLDTSELTYNRYLGIAQEVFLSGIDNLAAVVSVLKSISEIDVEYISEHLKQLRSSADPEALEVQEEIKTLETRLQMRQEQLNKIKHLLLENEEAMTQLDETTVAIADMDTGQGEAEIDMENSMKALAEITERAPRYSQ
jgi:hypothetical protein